jgi:hypothetical protein
MRTERIVEAFRRAGAQAALDGPGGPKETTAYLGRAVVALASDGRVIERSGQLLDVGTLAREYGFTDVDGTQPPPFRMPARISRSGMMRWSHCGANRAHYQRPAHLAVLGHLTRGGVLAPAALGFRIATRLGFALVAAVGGGRRHVGGDFGSGLVHWGADTWGATIFSDRQRLLLPFQASHQSG